MHPIFACFLSTSFTSWRRSFFFCFLSVDFGTTQFSRKIYLPSQSVPSPEYPSLQVQLYDPSLLLHKALTLHLSVPKAHSSTSGKHIKVVLLFPLKVLSLRLSIFSPIYLYLKITIFPHWALLRKGINCHTPRDIPLCIHNSHDSLPFLSLFNPFSSF